MRGGSWRERFLRGLAGWWRVLSGFRESHLEAVMTGIADLNGETAGGRVWFVERAGATVLAAEGRGRLPSH